MGVSRQLPDVAYVHALVGCWVNALPAYLKNANKTLPVVAQVLGK